METIESTYFHAPVSFLSIIHNRYSGGNGVHLETHVGSIPCTCLLPPNMYRVGQGRRMDRRIDRRGRSVARKFPL